MLVAAAVCPHPPLLIPAAMGAAGLTVTVLAGNEQAGNRQAGNGRGRGGADAAALASDAELREVRTSCVLAVAALLAAAPDLLAVVGGAAGAATYTEPVAGSLQPFGVPCTTGAGQPVLPLSLTVGAWLLEQARQLDQAGPGSRAATRRASGDRPGGDVPCRVQLRAVASGTATADCLRLGAELAGLAPRVALLAMGDASARKAVGVHGAADPAAERYDAEVAAALGAADPGRLARLDPALDAELMIAGRAAWQVLAGAAGGVFLRGQLRCAAAPFDVTYLVASWLADG